MAVHSLQRAIHNGMITAKHGRTTEQLGAISGALTLLTNVVMAWNTHHLQAAIDLAPGDHADDLRLTGDHGEQAKLGLTCQLAFWREHARFPEVEADVAPAVVEHLARQIRAPPSERVPSGGARIMHIYSAHEKLSDFRALAFVQNS